MAWINDKTVKGIDAHSAAVRAEIRRMFLRRQAVMDIKVNARTLAIALNWMGHGVDYRGCTKGHLADVFAIGDYDLHHRTINDLIKAIERVRERRGR